MPTKGEEIVNSITHGLGALLSLIGLAALIMVAARRSGPLGPEMVACVVYGFSLLLLYVCSTLYHAISHRGAKRVMRVLDHCAIYLLIAGTYTPFTLLTLRGPWGQWLFAIIWLLAAAGLIFKCFLTGRLQIFSTVTYILMGWVGIIALRPLLAALPWHAVVWILAGGLFYTGGVAFFAGKWRYAHSVWHVFVMAGSICHFVAVYAYVLPRA